jgi:hypothetical protein
MAFTQISQWLIYSYNNAPQIIYKENQNNRPTMDIWHRLQSDRPIRKEAERKRFDIARSQYCNRLGHIASECRTLAFKKRDGRSEDNWLTNINNADRLFRDRSEAPPLYRNDNGQRSFPSHNTIHNDRNNGLGSTKTKST